MGPIGPIAWTCRATGIDMRAGSALLLGALIIVTGGSPAGAQEAPAATHTDQAVPAPVQLPPIEVEAPPPLSAPADPASRRPAPTHMGSPQPTSRICRPARTPRSPMFLLRCPASRSIRTSRSTSATPKVRSSNTRSTGPWSRSTSIPTRRSSRCSIRRLCRSWICSMAYCRRATAMRPAASST